MDNPIVISVVSVIVGWAVGAQNRPSQAPCQCQCGCHCESSLSFGSWAGILVGSLAVIGLASGLWVHRGSVAGPSTDVPQGKGQRGVFGVQGRSLSLTS